MTHTIRVTASGAGISYFPEFLSRHLGFFEDQGLVLEVDVAGHGPFMTRALDSGEADIALGGVWRPLMYRGRLSTYWVFAQLCARCPTVLVGKGESDSFQWSDLEGKAVLVPDGAPSPWMLLGSVLQRTNIKLDHVQFIQDFMTSEATDLFRGGLADFFLTGPPVSTALVDAGIGHVVATLADEAGDIPWSVYYARREWLDHPDNLGGRFNLGLEQGLDWVQTHDPGEVLDLYAQHFPNLDPEVAAQAVRDCRDLGIYPTTAEVSAPSLARWQPIIKNYGLTDRIFEYGEIVDSRPAAWVTDNQ